MSTPFYDLASLVVVPSGYKASKVYAQKPLTTDGQLAFTRSTGATRVASNGLIEKVRTNLLLQSNTFSTTWATTNATVTSGQSGYDGTNNAWLLDKSGTQGRITQSITQSDLQTLSIYAKKGTSEYLRMFVNGPNSSVYFNLNNGTIQSSSAIVSGKSTDVGGGWYRFEVAFTGSTTAVNYYPAEAGSTTGTSGNILIQNAQLEVGDIATDYIATTTTAVSVGPVSGLPRLDYLNSSCPRLILEPSRTNLIDYTEYLNGWSLQSGIVISDNQTTSPEGVQNAGIATSTAANSRIQKNLGTLGSNYVFSAFVKSVGVGTRMELRSNITGDNLILDVAASGEVTHFSDTAVNNNYDIENYGNGWYRVWFEGATDGAASNYYQIYPDVQSGNRSVYVWGIQMEAGSYPTSLIPTNGTSVTRVADAARTASGATSLFNSTWTAFGELIIPAKGTAGTATGFGLRNTYGGINPADFVYNTVHSSAANSLDFLWYASGVATKTVTVAITYGTRIKFAVTSDGILYVNGVQVSASSSLTSATPVEFAFGRLGQVDASNGEAESVAQALLFKSILTSAQLAELTTL
jgi:hypothetical protein